MKKRILSVLLCLCMVMVLLPTMALADSEYGSGSTSISTFEELQTAFSTGGEYTLAQDITVTGGLTLASGKTLTIHGNGHAIQPAVTGLNEQGLVNADASAITNIIYNSGTLTLENLTIYGGQGRCIYNYGELTMTGVSLERAHLTSGYGAGLYNSLSAKALLTNCNIRRNGCDSSGGGFYNSGTLILENCAIVENRNFGTMKGGGAGENSAGAKLYMNNCTVANNQSSEIGGGINNYGGTAYIMNSTFTGNVTTATAARQGGGIGNNGGTVYAVNSVFAFNYANNMVSDIGLYSGSSVYLYNCAYGTIVKSDNTTEEEVRVTCKKLATENSNDFVSVLFNGARTSGIVDMNGNEDATTTFARPVITQEGSTYGVYPATSSDLRSGGTTTYYDRDGFTVKMSYDSSSSTKTNLGSLDTADTVVKCPDGSERATGLIGAWPANIEITAMYTVKVNPAAGGTVTGGSAQGNSYPAGTSTISITAVPSTGYAFSGWKVGTGTGISSTDNPYSITNLQADVTLTPVFEEAPIYSIALSQTEPYAFPGATVGYGEQTPLSVIVTNTGNNATGALTVALTDGDTTAFAVSPATINSIAATNDTGTFTVQPNTGLAAGTYTATVTVSGANIVASSFNVSFTVSASSGGGSYTPPSYKVDTQLSENANGTVSANPGSARLGDTVTITVTPDRYYKVDGVTVKDKNGNEIAVTDHKNGTFTFRMPGSNVTVEAIFSWENPFTDVAEDAYYTPAVEWALKNSITNGTGDGTPFSPDVSCTRAQAMTFLWRAAGSPAPKSGTMPFCDVAADAYYYDAVLWAMEQGITKGTSATTFSPDAVCTRGQIVAFLYRAAGSPTVPGSVSFRDVPAGSYCADAVVWAVQNDVTKGTENGKFSPNADCSRAQIMTFLYRWLVK